jgi:hypothetical protein
MDQSSVVAEISALLNLSVVKAGWNTPKCPQAKSKEFCEFLLYACVGAIIAYVVCEVIYPFT